MALSRADFLACNRRRIDLIRKRYRDGGLDPTEAAELESLQADVTEYVRGHGVRRAAIVATPVDPRDEPGADDAPPSGDVPMTSDQLLETTDAKVWAEEFCRIVGEHVPGLKGKSEWVRGWFANAIEAGREAGRRDAGGAG